jgi:hypothetical protein
MQNFSLSEISSQLPLILDLINKGESIEFNVHPGENIIAKLIPFEIQTKRKRNIGLLAGKATLEISDDFEITTEELLNIK